MISFLKKNSHTLIRMNTFQMAMIVFSIAVLTATVRIFALRVCASLLAIGLYCYLLYNETWEIGAKDAIKIERGYEKYSMWKGLYLSIGANLLNLLLALIVVIFKAILVLVNSAAILNITGSGAWKAFWTLAENTPEIPGIPTTPGILYNLYAIPKTIVHILQFMYAGIFPKLLPNNPIVYLIALLPPFLFCFLGYIAGVKNFTIFPKKKQVK